MRYVILGWATVFDSNGDDVTDRDILHELSGFVDQEDLYATDYLGGDDTEDQLRIALKRSGLMRFELHEDEEELRVFNEYLAIRVLTDSELECLCKFTLGQWSDGMGECLFVPDGKYKGYKLQPLSQHEVSIIPYPIAEIVAG